jgi:putative PEP-CTERM system histidine kinase
MCQIVQSDAGSLWLCDENETRFLHAADWPTANESGSALGIPVSDPLIAFMQRCGWVVDLRERDRSPQLYDNAEAPAGLRVLGDDAIVVPLLHVESMYGVMLLRRPPGRDTLHFEDRDLLKTVGRHLAAHLWQADIDRRLANSKQFEAYNRLTAFVMHDLKNLTAQLQLVVSNAAKHKRNPEFVDDAIATIANSVDRMGKLLAQLAQDARTGSSRSISLADVAQRVALRAGTRQPAPTLKVNADAKVVADPEQLSMVLDHVVRNAQDATADQGEVVIEIDVDGDTPRLRVSDTGAGMDDVFVRDRLFRPFDTTKGARGMGIGAYQVREYLRSLGGEVVVNSAPGRGTTFTLVFPHV